VKAALKGRTKRAPVAGDPLHELALGEDSTRQFKRDITNSDVLAAEMAAFANSEGGTLFLGVDDDGTTPGLSADDGKRMNQLIGNTANHSVRSPLTVSTKNRRRPSASRPRESSITYADFKRRAGCAALGQTKAGTGK
jgi:hypothetical protein